MRRESILIVNKCTLFSLLIGCGILLFNASIRNVISGSMLMAFNLPVYFAFLCCVPKSHGVMELSRSFLSRRVTIWLGIILLMLGSMARNGVIKPHFIISIAVPIIVGYIEIWRSEDIRRIFCIWIIILNSVLAIVAVGGVIDVLFGYPVTEFFTELYHTEAILQMRIDEPSRIISVLGHPLFGSEIGLIGCICNYIDVKFLKTQKRPMLGYFYGIVVIALSGSKTAFLLALVIALMLSSGHHKMRNFLLLAIAGYVVYALGLFDIILGRFIHGIESGDITTGRNVRLLELYQTGMLEFKFFSGHAEELSERFIIALEYPLLRLSYKYGVIFAICISLVIFVRPLVLIFKRRQNVLGLCLLLLIVDVNTYSGLVATGDGMLLYNIMLFFILNLSKYMYSNES